MITNWFLSFGHYLDYKYGLNMHASFISCICQVVTLCPRYALKSMWNQNSGGKYIYYGS